jgi:hypothetical protein
MNMIDWITAGNSLQSLRDTEMCLKEELAELDVELTGYSGTQADKIKELADVIWCATAMIEKLGYDSVKIMGLLAKNNASKVYLSYLKACDEVVLYHKPGCDVELFGDTGRFVVVDGNNKIQKPANFIKITAADIEMCKY